MNKVEFYYWLEQRRMQLAALIYNEIRQKSEPTQSLPSEEALNNVNLFITRFLDYLKTGDMRFMIIQIEETNRKKLARGDLPDIKSTEKQVGYIFRAIAEVVATGNFSPTEQNQFLNQVERNLNSFIPVARTVHTRLLLEQTANVKF